MTDRHFGIELEIAGITKQRAAKVLRLVGLQAAVEGYNHTTRNHWKVVSDSSVRDGFEVVSPVLQGEKGLEDVRTAITALDDSGARINVTCGVHVHFDAGDLNCDEFKAIIKRYAKFEDKIDSIMPRSRRGNSNTYCKSIKSFARSTAFNRANSIQTLVRAQNSRYYKLNLQSFPRHGTLEFRQHSGTVNAPKAVNWIRFLAAFIEASRESLNQPEGVSQVRPSLTGKLALVFALIQESGATSEALMEATGWQRHTLRAAITRLRQTGIEIQTRRANGRTTYSATAQTSQAGTQTDSLFRGIDKSVQKFYENRAAVLAA